MRTPLGTLLGAALCCAGCFSAANIKGKHAKFHGCKADDVEVQELDSTGHAEYRTTGCGHEETYFCIGMKCRSPRLLSISEFEAAHRCKEKEIEAAARGALTFDVSGCGASAVYECRQVPDQVIECVPGK